MTNAAFIPAYDMNHISLLNAARKVHVRTAWSEGRWHAKVASLLAARQDRPLLSLVACPLAMVAVTLAGSESPAILWSLAPLVILTWWWGSAAWPWDVGPRGHGGVLWHPVGRHRHVLPCSLPAWAHPRWRPLACVRRRRRWHRAPEPEAGREIWMVTP